jgi:hypothetical protein
MSYKQVKRECGDCSECCNGWLWGAAHGKQFYSGKPCHFVGPKGCTIYDDRPHNPCVIFRCGWLDDHDAFPEWMKPSLSKVIAQKLKTKSGIEFYKVWECGQKIDSIVLNNLILYSLQNGVNMNIQVGGGWASYGTREYLNELNG